MGSEGDLTTSRRTDSECYAPHPTHRVPGRMLWAEGCAWLVSSREAVGREICEAAPQKCRVRMGVRQTYLGQGRQGGENGHNERPGDCIVIMVVYMRGGCRKADRRRTEVRGQYF